MGKETTTIQLRVGTRNRMRLINTHAGFKSFDELIAGYLLPLAEEMAQSKRPEKVGIYLTSRGKNGARNGEKKT